MARARQKTDRRGPLQRLIDRDRVANDVPNEPSSFVRQHGDYERVHAIGSGGEINMRPHINRGGTPIARWRRDGHISESQDAAIAHCIALWEIVGSSGKLVANLDRTIFGCPGDGHPREIEARDNLARVKAYFTPKLWDVWENVVRFDEPAGVAGSRLERAVSARELAARHAVQFVADIIAMKERLSY